jgi:hypothetical protein
MQLFQTVNAGRDDLNPVEIQVALDKIQPGDYIEIDFKI